MAWYRCGGTPSEVLSLPTPSEASGAIARFNTDLTENLLSAVAEFSASQASGTPTPANPIPIVGVDKVNVTRTGKNLFNPNTMISGYIATNGHITTAGTTNKERTGDYVEVKDTSKYLTLSLDYGTTQEGWGGFGWYDANKNFISRNATTQSGITKLSISRKPPENAKYFRATLRTYGNTDIQVEITETTTATTYEPYNGTIALINLGGTYYGGSVDEVTGKITLSHGALMPTGSDFTIYSSGIFYCDIPANYQGDNFRFSTLGSHFKRFEGGWASMPDQNFQAYNRLGIRYDAYTTKEDFQNWVDGQISANTPLVFVFPLVNPIVVYASNTAEIPTIVGDNQVFADTGDVAVKFFETVGHKI